MTDFNDDHGSALGSFIVDGKGTILGFDQGMESLTGWPAIDIVGHHKDLNSSTQTIRGVKSLDALPLYEGRIPSDTEPAHLEITFHCRDGRRVDAETVRRPLNGPGDRLLVTVQRVLASSAHENGVPQARGRDRLTGLLDRAAFADRLTADFANAAATARPLSIVLVDVDRLRTINDRVGREAGDDVLQKIASILRATVDDDARVARLSNDDFAVILAHGSRSEARQVAAAVRAKVETFRFFTNHRNDVREAVTVSLGAASFPADADTEHELIERAGDALDEARSMGRNRVWCYVRRPRVPVQVPVYFDNTDSVLLGYMRDLSPSGIFLQTTAGIDIGMRCALAFPLPGHDGRVHVVGRVVRTVTPETSECSGTVRIPGVGVEFERFGGAGDRRAIDSFLHSREATTLRPETGILSVDS